MSIRRQLVQRLESRPALRVVGEAGDEAQALALIARTAPQIVLLDLSLAEGGSGLAVLKALRRQGFAGQIHVLSHQTEAYRQAVLGAGADGFFDKAGELDQLMDLLDPDPQPEPVLLAPDPLWTRLDQAVRLAARDGADLAVFSLPDAAGPGLQDTARAVCALLDQGDLMGLGEQGQLQVVLSRLDDREQAGQFAERLRQLRPGAALGQALFPWEALSAGGLLTLADARAGVQVGIQAGV